MSLFFYLSTLTQNTLAWEIKTTNTGKPLHWKQSEIHFFYNANYSGLSAQEVASSIEAAGEAWSTESIISFQNQGETNRRQIDYTDEQFAIYFEQNWSAAPEILALTYTWSTSDGEIVHFDIELNAEHFQWGTDGSSQKHDLQNTLTHEIGHAIGLDHSSIAEATMAPSSVIGETSKRILHEDDKEGKEYIYSHPLETSGGSQNTPSSNSNGSSGTGNDNPDQPTSLGGGSYSTRKPVSACSTSAAPLYLLWITLIGLLRRLR